VTWFEAEAYANWRGGRLPSEAEWEYAARGPQSAVYPWGDTFDASKLNAQDRLGKAAPVGSYESGKSWVGAYDLSGNVWEWVADWYSDTYYLGSVENDPPGPASGNRRAVRSSGWNVAKDQTRAANRFNIWPEASDGVFGFRVVTPTGS
jgi:formylglycine-generating enzyme required for sulfatase activity